MTDKPHVIIIGAGFTGTATAYDLAQRGCRVTVVERGEIASGTSGRTHGLLHSGARYCVNDPESAAECIAENATLARITPQCIETNGGLFIGVDESDRAYREKFMEGAQSCQLPHKEISAEEALRIEPNLNPNLHTAFLVQDGTFDPLRLAFAFAASAQSCGASFKIFNEVTGLSLDNQNNVNGVLIWDRKNDHHYQLQADLVVNAAGAWAGKIAAMANIEVPVLPTAGVMVAYDRRLVQRAVNRLNMPGDGDIAIPQRRMVVVGTTSFQTEDLDYIPVYPDQTALMLQRGSELIPGLRECQIRGAYMSSRPLIASGAGARSETRTFKCFDHAQKEGVGQFVTITGGKATTCRAMAEKTADLVCKKLQMSVQCKTHLSPLKSYREFHYEFNQ